MAKRGGVVEQKDQDFCIGQESQVARFLKKWQPPYKNMEPKYISLCDDLQTTLQKVYPGCKVHRFGSTVTGLYFINSDVDVFVELDEQNPNLNVKETNRKSNESIFAEITALLTSRTSTCEFLHIPTKIRYNFNCKSVIWVHNSVFIHYIMSLDNRLGQLMMVIKYWAKIQGLIRTSGFSNYSLTIMYISYLQHVYSLPSIRTLQTVHSINVQEDWNVGMDYSSHFTSPYLNETAAEDILLGFFDYYSFFKYDMDIICPFLGHPITKLDFHQFDSLKSMFQFYNANVTSMKPLQVKSEICVMAPFEHVSNVTARVEYVYVKRFVALCTRAVNIFERRPVRCNALEYLFEVRCDQPTSNKLRKTSDMVEEKKETKRKRK